MKDAKPGDHVVKITCRCGEVLVAGWAADTWTCQTCKMRGKTRVAMVLGTVGWDEYVAPILRPVQAATGARTVGGRRLADRAVRLATRAFPGTVVVEEGEAWWKRTRKRKGQGMGEGML